MGGRTLAVTVASLLVTVGLAGAVGAQPACIDHPPIEITEDEGPDGFALATLPTGEEIHRPGSGVVHGSGTAEDPYVIEGWCIADPLGGSDVGIRIADTDSHVLVTGNAIEDGFATGIALENADHVTIADNTVTGHDQGIVASSATDLDVEANTVSDNGERFDGNGVTVQDAFDAEIRDNQVSDNAENGIEIEGAERVDVAGNEVTGHGFDGIEIDEATDVAVRQNTLENNDGHGVYVDDTLALLVGGNAVHDNGEGIGLRESQDVVVERNNVTEHEREAVAAFRVDDVSLSDNELADNGEGVDVTEASAVALAGNAIAGNGVGLDVSDVADAVDARGNWWGAGSGPGGGIEDACTGELADGDGDRIEADAADVCFADWLDEAP
jgi:parallel beta-helix repeat protein